MALIDLQSYHDTTALQDGESDAQVADTGNTSNNTAADDSHAEYLKRFPDFADNPYFQAMPRKHRLLTELIIDKLYHTLGLIMRLNERVKRSAG